MASSPNPYRLPTDVAPTRYRIAITPDIDAAVFTGRVEIDLDVRRPTSRVVLHAVDLELGSIRITDARGAVGTATPVPQAEYETVTIGLDRELEVGSATIEIEYRGILNDQLVGFYRSSYVDESGQTRWIATTQFEATDARRAMPCFDEPTMKAVFEVTLDVPAGLAGYSNSPVVGEETRPDGGRRIRFAPTMKMSSYLVAFVIGPFEETDAEDVGGVPLRVVAPVGKSHLGAFAQEAGAHALRFFSDYFAIPYPGEKLDLVAVPDFAFGAMENLGCVTFRETALLVDPETASLAELERVATVVAHEIAHMWFGDLVTMQWWEGIWLNEAFATMMEVLCTDHFRPQWKAWLSFATERERAMAIDGLHTTRPIEYEVVAPSDMRGMFDALTYEKGGSVLRMLEQHLSPDVFRDGIRRYLSTHAYSNTVTTDLWDALEEVSGQPVRDTMNTWILQGGHPVVSFEGGQLSQAPFAYGPRNGRPSAIGERWITPVATRTLAGGPVERLLLREDPVALTGTRVVNAGGYGVFRTRYGSEELAAVAGSLDQLDEIERAVLFSDAWAALLSGGTRWADYLGLARRLRGHDEPATWSSVAGAFDMVARAATDAQRERLAGPAREVFGSELERLGWTARPGESELSGQVRAIAIGVLGTLGADAAVQARCAELAADGELDGDLARAVLRVVAAAGRRTDYEDYLQRYRDTENPQDKIRYLFTLAEFPVEDLLLDAAERCFGEFRTQDGPILLGALSRQPVGGTAVWRYTTSRWADVTSRFSPNLQIRVASGLPVFINDRAFAAEVAAFHRSHPIAGEERTIEQSIERMEIGLSFTEAIRPQLDA